jgi:DNA-binding MarR family transcriptional regulator
MGSSTNLPTKHARVRLAMKTKVQITSVQNYHKLDKTTIQYKIFQYIDNEGPCSIGEIAFALNLEKSTVSARVNELVHEKKTVEEAGKLADRITGIRSIHWRVAE